MASEILTTISHLILQPQVDLVIIYTVPYYSILYIILYFIWLLYIFILFNKKESIHHLIVAFLCIRQNQRRIRPPTPPLVWHAFPTIVCLLPSPRRSYMASKRTTTSFFVATRTKVDINRTVRYIRNILGYSEEQEDSSSTNDNISLLFFHKCTPFYYTKNGLPRKSINCPRTAGWCSIVG